MWGLIIIIHLLSLEPKGERSPKLEYYLSLYEKTKRKDKLLMDIEKELSHKRDPELEKIYKILLEKHRRKGK